MIAPMFGNRLPTDIEFSEVECEDLSTGGFAFYSDGRPPFEILIVKLGRYPSTKRFRARVLNVTELNRNGAVVYRIGCEFIDRILS